MHQKIVKTGRNQFNNVLIFQSFITHLGSTSIARTMSPILPEKVVQIFAYTVSLIIWPDKTAMQISRVH